MQFVRKTMVIALLLGFGRLSSAEPTQDSAALTAALFPEPTAEFALPGFATGSFTRYDQVHAYLETIGRTSHAELYSLLKTEQGRSIWALKLPNPKARLRLMVYARVHGNEPAASEGALQFIDALTRGELKGKHDALEIVVIPMANPDGSVAGRRDTAKGGDINRDFVKYDYAETRAIQTEIQRFDPDIIVDAHEFTVWGRLGKLSSDIDLQSAGPNEPNLPPKLISIHDSLFRKAITANFREAGLRHGLYELLSTNKSNGRLQVSESAMSFISGKNFHAMSGRISFLLETRGIGLGEQHLVRRTLSQYLAIKTILQTAQANADMLKTLLNDARREIADRTTWEVDRKAVRQERLFPLADSTSNAVVEVPADFVNRTAGRVVSVVPVPRYYLIPQSQKKLVEVLTLMGVRVETLRKPLDVAVGVQTVSYPESSTGAAVSGASQTETAHRRFESGDFVVDTRQRAGLYLQVLEAASPNSFAQAGLFGSQGKVELPFYRFDESLSQ